MYKRKIITTMPANVRWSPICLTCGRESLTDEDVTCPTCGSARASWEEITQKSFDPKPLEGYNHYEAVCPTCGTRKTVHLLGDLKLLRNLDTVRCGVRGHAPTILNPYLKQLPKHAYSAVCIWCEHPDFIIYSDDPYEVIKEWETECPNCGAPGRRRLTIQW